MAHYRFSLPEKHGDLDKGMHDIIADRLNDFGAENLDRTGCSSWLILLLGWQNSDIQRKVHGPALLHPWHHLYACHSWITSRGKLWSNIVRFKSVLCSEYTAVLPV